MMNKIPILLYVNGTNLLLTLLAATPQSRRVGQKVYKNHDKHTTLGNTKYRTNSQNKHLVFKVYKTSGLHLT